MLHSQRVFFLWFFTVGLMADGATRAAKMQRKRWLRPCLIRERMTLLMEMAAALHHSALTDEKPEKNDATRRQKRVNSREKTAYLKMSDEEDVVWGLAGCQSCRCLDEVMPIFVKPSRMVCWNISFTRTCSKQHRFPGGERHWVTPS